MRILDGPVGTELEARGVRLPAPLWSASAVIRAPDVLAAIHRDYAVAGATVHTAATFRTTRRAAAGSGQAWEALARRAVAIARDAIAAAGRGRDARLAGSVAPLEDCYRPDLSPADLASVRAEHGELASVLADAGCDLLLCEAFPLAREASIAVDACVGTGVETWAALTAGPSGALMTPDEMERAARACVDAGARAVLVNCVAASRTLPYVERLARIGVPFGAYANAGAPEEAIGWRAAGGSGESDGAADEQAAARYLAHARTWAEAGATILGGCCGTGPSHIAALARAFA